MNYKTIREFDNDYKKLAKKFKTLESDFSEFKKILNKFPLGVGKHFCTLTIGSNTRIIKARFFCQSLKKKDMRIIYAYSGNCHLVEFIEIFFEGDKPREDGRRIKSYFSNSQ